MENKETWLGVYYKKKKDIRSRLREFSQIKTKEDIFYELCFCTLTPQTKGKLSWEVILKLKEHDFMNKAVDPKPFLYGKIRFHNNKSKYLLENKKNFPSIWHSLNSINDSKKLRLHLIEHIHGFGLKEASHFLRNIGHKDLDILDRHILKNLKALKVIRGVPKTLTPKKYFLIEEKFRKFAARVGIPMDELDLLFWCIETGEVFK